jgi:hypothetical protein
MIACPIFRTSSLKLRELTLKCFLCLCPTQINVEGCDRNLHSSSSGLSLIHLLRDKA